MADTASGNGRVTLAVLQNDVKHLTERVDIVIEDHENRLRHIEKQSTWKWVAHVAQGIGLGLSSWFGTRA